MDWIRENKMLAGILGVIAAGTLGLGYVLYGAWSSFSASKDQYLELGNQIAQIKSLSLEPTEENLAAKKALVEEYASNVNKLGGALLVLQDSVLPKPLKDIEFQAKLKERTIEIRKMASALKVQIPAEFAFGFDPYNSAPPPNEAATELSGYLDAIEAVVKLAMGCKVASIDLLERSQIAEEKGGSGDTSSASKSKGKSAAKSQAAATARPAAAPISEKRQLSMVLTLDQGALQLLMAKLANPADMPYFTSVRLLRIENQVKVGARKVLDTTADANAQPVIESPAPGESKEGVAAAGPVEIKPPPAAKPDSYPIMGQELLKIQVEIDLVKFLPSARGVAAAPTAAPSVR